MGAVKVTREVYWATASAYRGALLHTIIQMVVDSPAVRDPTVPNPYGALLAALPVRTGNRAILGSDTHYWDYGPLDAPVTLIAVHGFRGDHHGLEPIVAQLEGIRIISPDLPGFGESTPMTGAGHDIPGYAAWLRALVDELGLAKRPVVLGHSFGSIVSAAAVAGGLATPTLILINPIAAPALKGPKAFLTGVAVGYYRFGAWLPRGLGYGVLASRLVTRVMSQGMAKTKDSALRRWIHDQHRSYFSRFSDRDTMLDAFRASTANNVMEFAPDIAIPTLLIAASNDPITTVADEEKLRDLLPDAELHVLADVGHLIHYERPREAAEVIVTFLGVGRLAAPR
jgi:pimeloyl-ACP methyl ester carboxylesterase